MPGHIDQLAEQIAEAIEAGQSLEALGRELLDELGEATYWRWHPLGEALQGPILIVRPGWRPGQMRPETRASEYLDVAAQIV